MTWGCGRPSVDLDVNLVFLGAAAISPAQKFLRGGIFTVAHYWIIGTIITNQTADITHTSRAICYGFVAENRSDVPRGRVCREQVCFADYMGGVGPG